jgi:S-adenosylmethionine synthetase
MKTKIGIVILAAACAALAIALVAAKKSAADERKDTVAAMLDFSNQLVNARDAIDDLNQVNLKLTNDLAVSRQQELEFSNNYAETAAVLTGTKFSLQSADEKITGLGDRVAGLESQNQALGQNAASLSNQLASVSDEMAGAQQKLADDETNNAFLVAELQKQMEQKNEMEQKFNDPVQLRAQIKKVRDEQFVAKRLEWIRNGTDPSVMHKGGQLLMRHAPATNAVPSGSSHFDLSVEVGSDGSIRVLPPPTNSPAH